MATRHSVREPATVEDAPTPRGQLRRLVDPHTLYEGLVGGFVATVAMTAYRLPIARSLPPTAEFWATYVAGGDPEEYPGIGLLLHLAYGMASGAGFAIVYDRLGRARSTTPETRGTTLGLVYGLVLSRVGQRVILGRLLGNELDADEALVFHLGHVVYGLTLGTWIGSRESGP